MSVITHFHGRLILGSLGLPALECTLSVGNQPLAIADVPLTSTSQPSIDYSPVLHFVNQDLSSILLGQNPVEQEKLDQLLHAAANLTSSFTAATLAASLTLAQAAAQLKEVSLFQHLADLAHNDLPLTLPVPMAIFLDYSQFSNLLDFSQFLLLPNPAETLDYPTRLQLLINTYYQLQQLIQAMDHPLLTTITGAFAPKLHSNEGALMLLTQAVTLAGYQPLQNLQFCLNLSSPRFYQNSAYHLKDSSEPLTFDQYHAFLEQLNKRYPLHSLIDPVGPNQSTQWSSFLPQMPSDSLIFGHALINNHSDKLKEIIDQNLVNGIVLEPYHFHTLTDFISIATLARSHNLALILAQSPNNPPGTFLADLAVAIGSDFIKLGAPNRGEHTTIYNRLLEIHHQLV